MMSLVYIALLALQSDGKSALSALPQDPWKRSEWQLVSDPSTFGRDGLCHHEFPDVEPQPAPPIRAGDWIFAPRALCDGFAGPLVRWFLDPDAKPPTKAEAGAEKAQSANH